MQDIKNDFVAESMHSFLTLPGEKILIVQRKHIFTLLLPLFIAGILGLASILFSFFGTFILLNSPLIAIISTVTLFVVSTSVTTKITVDWYFHLYVITNRKIVEVYCTPLFSHVINDILLDQVRCTEIDIKMQGVIREVLNMGDVVFTFDRPTHQEEIILTDIKNPREIGIFLGDVLSSTIRQSSSTTWHQSKDNPNKFRFTEEIFPKNSVGFN
ncbi:MAG: hypothetical protein M1524_00050 [Patescibacteria group bacterium]|nr:hypothetical protein [Patescibacteria group bacterium]